jgi:hypothetical protein
MSDAPISNAGYARLPLSMLTKRDYFAAHAAEALLTCPWAQGDIQAAAKSAVAMADAMIAELNKGAKV